MRRTIFTDFSIPRDNKRRYPLNSEVLLRMGHCPHSFHSDQSRREYQGLTGDLTVPVCRHLAPGEMLLDNFRPLQILGYKYCKLKIYASECLHKVTTSNARFTWGGCKYKGKRNPTSCHQSCQFIFSSTEPMARLRRDHRKQANKQTNKPFVTATSLIFRVLP